MSAPVRFLDGPGVERLLDLPALVDALAVAMTDLSAGRAGGPPRIAYPTSAGLLAAIPAHSPGLGVLAAKLLTVHPDDVAAGHPVHQALIAAFDPATGRPLVIMDGEAVTAAFREIRVAGRDPAKAAALASRLAGLGIAVLPCDIAGAVAAGIVEPDAVVEIGELVAGSRAGRTDARQTTVYRSVGVAVQDAAAVAVVLERM